MLAIVVVLPLSFIGNKLGLWTGRGPAFAGMRVFDSLGVPAEVHAALRPRAPVSRAR